MKTFTFAILASVFILAGCEEKGTAEQLGENIDEAARDVRGAIDEAVNDTDAAIEDACEEIKDAANAENPNC